jgi:hypothetical protein
MANLAAALTPMIATDLNWEGSSGSSPSFFSRDNGFLGDAAGDLLVGRGAQGVVGRPPGPAAAGRDRESC